MRPVSWWTRSRNRLLGRHLLLKFIQDIYRSQKLVIARSNCTSAPCRQVSPSCRSSSSFVAGSLGEEGQGIKNIILWNGVYEQVILVKHLAENSFGAPEALLKRGKGSLKTRESVGTVYKTHIFKLQLKFGYKLQRQERIRGVKCLQCNGSTS